MPKVRPIAVLVCFATAVVYMVRCSLYGGRGDFDHGTYCGVQCLIFIVAAAIINKW